MNKLLGHTEISGFIRLPEVLEIIPISKSAWWDGISKGIYPKPVKLSVRTSAWRVSDIQILIARINCESSHTQTQI